MVFIVIIITIMLCALCGRWYLPFVAKMKNKVAKRSKLAFMYHWLLDIRYCDIGVICSRDIRSPCSFD